MKRLMIVLLLLCGSVSAQIPARLDSLRVRVFTNLKLGSSGSSSITTAMVNQKINDAQTAVCQDFDAFEKFDTLLVHSGLEGDTIANDFLRVSMCDRMSQGLRYPMIQIKPEERWEKGEMKTGADYDPADTTKPRYFYVYANRLVTYPRDKKPSTKPDSLFVGYWAIGRVLTADSVSTDIYPEFRDALLMKATAMVWRVRQGAGSPEAAALEAQYAGEVLKYGRKAK